MKRLIFLALLVLAPGAIRAAENIEAPSPDDPKPFLAPLFCDHAVLQRDREVPVWGWTTPKEKVTVTFHDQKVEGTAGDDGRWMVKLAPMKASAESSDLTATVGGKTTTLHDVLVGEVWVCSGQSNMEWRVDQSDNAAKEIASANYPLIRHFRVPHVMSDTPVDFFKTSETWTPTTPVTVKRYSGVAYFFARDLYENLHVPIGLINTSWGGKMIEVFMSQEAIAGDPNAAALQKRWEEEKGRVPAQMKLYEEKMAKAGDTATKPATSSAADSGEETGPKTLGAPMNPEQVARQHHPSCIFNAMMNPVIPYGIRGVIWYQGEHNIARAGEYHSLFTSLITDWRKKFGQGDFPFYFAQLSTFVAPLDKTHVGYAELREAQFQTLQTVPNTGMAVTIDVGLPGAVRVHPTDKQDVGARLARIAKANTYGLGGEFSGPLFKSAAKDKDGIRVDFDHVAGGLVLKESAESPFELAGGDGKFVPATARIDGKSLIVQAPSVPDPVSVRYAWADAPTATLFNTEGLPASSFRATVGGK